MTTWLAARKIFFPADELVLLQSANAIEQHEEMGSSSEDVLLMVPNVRHKKNDGVLYLMNERLGWMTGSKSSFSITHKYADVKSKWQIRNQHCWWS